jgi:hypothetical protein
MCIYKLELGGIKHIKNDLRRGIKLVTRDEAYKDLLEAVKRLDDAWEVYLKAADREPGKKIEYGDIVTRKAEIKLMEIEEEVKDKRKILNRLINEGN